MPSADRHHAVRLESRHRARNALAYVLLQERRHGVQRGERPPVALDACSSAPCFDGWPVAASPRAGRGAHTVMPPRMWLFTTGWKRYGLVDPLEVPGPRAR